MMQITLKQTADSIDPNQTTADPQASLAAYVAEVTGELQKAFPGCEVEHIELDDTRAFDVDSDEEENYHADCDEVQRIMELVYETGNFWA